MQLSPRKILANFNKQVLSLYRVQAVLPYEAPITSPKLHGSTFMRRDTLTDSIAAHPLPA